MYKLKNILNEAIPGYAEKDVTGLHKAKPGDYIEIGFDGSRFKERSKIAKVVSNNRLQDTAGNIFGRDGRLYRLKTSWWRTRYQDKKIISARQITEKEYKDSILSFVAEQLSKYPWSKLPIDKLKEISKIINLGFPQLDEFEK